MDYFLENLLRETSGNHKGRKGIVVGGLTPLTFIPILKKFITKSKKYIVVGLEITRIKKDFDYHYMMNS